MFALGTPLDLAFEIAFARALFSIGSAEPPSVDELVAVEGLTNGSITNFSRLTRSPAICELLGQDLTF